MTLILKYKQEMSRLRISSWYQEHLMQANSVFDLISSTYRALMQEIDSRPDVNFLALQNAVDDNTLKILDDFENMLIVRLQHTLSTDDIEFASIYEVIQLLRDDFDAIIARYFYENESKEPSP